MSFMNRFFGPQAQMRKLGVIKRKLPEADPTSTKLVRAAFGIYSKARNPLVEETALETLEECIRRCSDRQGIAPVVEILNKKADVARTMFTQMAGDQSKWETLASMFESDAKARKMITSLDASVTTGFFEWVISSEASSEYMRRSVFSIIIDKAVDKIELANRFIFDRDKHIAEQAVIILLDDERGWATLADALENDGVRNIVERLDTNIFTAPFLRWLVKSQERDLSTRVFAISRLEHGSINEAILEELLGDAMPEIAIRALMYMVTRGKLQGLAPNKAANAVAHMLRNESEWETLAAVLDASRPLKELVASMEQERVERFLFWLMKNERASMRNLEADINAQRDAAVLFKPAFEICGATREQRHDARAMLVRAALRSQSVAGKLVKRISELENEFDGANNFREQLWAAEVVSDFASVGVTNAIIIMRNMAQEMQEIVEDREDGGNRTITKIARFMVRRFGIKRDEEGQIVFGIEPKTYSYEDALKAVGPLPVPALVAKSQPDSKYDGDVSYTLGLEIREPVGDNTIKRTREADEDDRTQ